ncbi:hypothetical protein FRUB_05541 [Fimbriiglobus ruber]|uniref:Uncharacterized protein n=1 Tax=Fimbriiglobus ruber TaxID=1908690 RepID=A0A225DGQ1_9BACT|nr:hypothetical protein FRUB_05541 [Fimbriiglobus ruber]
MGGGGAPAIALALGAGLRPRHSARPQVSRPTARPIRSVSRAACVGQGDLRSGRTAGSETRAERECGGLLRRDGYALPPRSPHEPHFLHLLR